jgi:uncharacterized protein (DUF1501 family)
LGHLSACFISFRCSDKRIAEKMNRRDFLNWTGRGALGLAGLSLFSSIPGSFIWAESTRHQSIQALGNHGHTLIVILLRGAADGLNIVAPCGDPRYYDLRPNLALKAPNSGGQSALALDNYWGLHPALSSLMPYWNKGKMAFVHNCGQVDAGRSHFEAQDDMERGAKSAETGWMNRLLSVLPAEHTLVQAVNVGTTMPRILQGPQKVASLGDKNTTRTALSDWPRVRSVFDDLYAADERLGGDYQDGQRSRSDIAQTLSMKEEMRLADGGAPSPTGFSKTATAIASLIRGKNRPGQPAQVKAVFASLGGWDTHVNQGAEKGQLAGKLIPLGDGLALLMQQLGPNLNRTSIVVMSEFGRTVKENGNRGTDHGHGNVLWVLGGGVQGGKVYGDWAGLKSNQLFEGRDLPVTTDYRDVMASLFANRFRLSSGQIHQVFPDFNASFNASKPNAGLSLWSVL